VVDTMGYDKILMNIHPLGFWDSGSRRSLAGADMKTTVNILSVLFLTVATLLVLPDAAFTQQTLTVSPSVTSNTYPGVITLNITGLTNTEKVTIQRWFDGNANGTIDPGEPMMDAFKVTDNTNGNALIGGVIDNNIPYDLNPTNGVITTKLYLPEAMVLENMVGNYVFQVTSPTGRFTPVTATFAITNAPLGQSVSGIIYSNGVTPFPYAVVVAQDQQKNNPVGATMADANGHYYLTLPPSAYSLTAGFPGYYQNQSLAPSVILTNGMNVTNDMSLIAGGANVSGSVYDSANSNAIGGLLLTLQSSHLFAIAFTDTNGNYSAAVTPSFWKIQPTKQRLARRAYVLPEATFQVDVTSGLATNANIALPKGAALFYGRITDNSNVPYANIEFDGNFENNFDAKGYSDTNGNYAVAVLGDGTNFWSINANSGKNDALANFIVNQPDTVTLTNKQTVLDNFIALPATALINGHIQDNTGSNVVGLGLMATANIGGNNYGSLSGTTDNSGNYSLSVAAGQWQVELFTGNSSDTLDTLGYVDLTQPHIVNIPPLTAILNITVYPIGTPIITFPQRITATQFGFLITGATNVNYTVQYATNLLATNWVNLFSLTLTTNNAVFVSDPFATNKARFYRVQKN